MLHTLLVLCLLGAALATGTPASQLEKFVKDALDKSDSELEYHQNVLQACQGPHRRPVKIPGSPNATIAKLQMDNFLDFRPGNVKAEQDQAGQAFNLSFSIFNPFNVVFSGDLRIPSIHNNQPIRFYYAVFGNFFNLHGAVAVKKGKLVLDKALKMGHSGHAMSRLVTKKKLPSAFNRRLENYLDDMLPKCRKMLARFFSHHLKQQLSGHTARAILKGEARARSRRVPRQALNFNTYADHIIRTYRPALKKLDPLDLPDRYENFTTSSLLLPMHAQVFFYDGKVRGFSSLHRAGNVRYMSAGHKMKFVVPLGVTNLRQKYSARLSIGKLTKDFNLTSSIEHVRVTFTFLQGLSFRSKPEVKGVRVTSLGQIKVHYQGVGPLDWLLSRMASFFANSVRWDLVEHIEKMLKKLVDDHVLGSW